MSQALKKLTMISPAMAEIDAHTAAAARAQTASAHQRWRAAWVSGPKFVAWNEMPVQVGDAAPVIQLVDASGVPFSLDTAWAHGPALIVFLRHFACPYTWSRLERLATEVQQYAPQGATVYAIGQSEPERTQVFAAEYNVSVPMLCDPDRAAYRAYGVLEGNAAQIIYTNSLEGQKGLQYADSLLAQGRALVDSPWQLGAEFIINTAGKIALAHRYQAGEDFPRADLLVAAMEKATRP